MSGVSETAWGRFVLGPDGRVLSADAEALRIMGADARPGTLLELSLGDGDPSLLEARRRCLRGERATLSIAGPAGRRLVLLLDATRAGDQTAVVVLEVPRPGAAPPDTEREDEDEALAHAISHDVRAPLRAIEAFTSFLEEDSGDALPGPAKEHLARLRAATARLRTRLDSLVSYLRAARAGRKGHDSALRAANAVASRHAAAFEARGGSVSADGEDLGVAVAADALEEQLSRLVENALLHNPRPSPHARLSVRRDGAQVVVAVEDDGPGLTPSERVRALELFQRIGLREPEDPSAGAGLSIVRRAARRWGGDLVLDAGGLGGLRAKLLLPAAVAARAAA